MEFKLKQLETVKVERASRIINLPTETQYFFQGVVRRSIKITPRYTTWNSNKNQPEEIYAYDVIFVSIDINDVKIERKSFNVSDINDAYYGNAYVKKWLNDFIPEWINGHLKPRTAEDFSRDMEEAKDKIASV